MATRRSCGTRSEVVRCPNCGEDYSVTYKRCPFCDEKATESARYTSAEDDDESGRRSGGKRLASNSRGGGYGGGGWGPLRIVGTVVSLALIVAAVWIVISVISPMVNRGSELNSPNPTASPVVTPGPSETPPVEATPNPSETLPAEVTPEPTPSDAIPSAQTATSFTINREDFTISKAGEHWDLKPTFLPAGSTGTITWVSDKPEVASVSDAGVVTGLSGGTANITATMAGGYTQKCVVRCTFTGSAAPSTSPSGGSAGAGTSTGSVSLSHSDVSLYKAGESFRIRVSGTSSNPTWSTSDSGVASVSGDGTVTAVGKGTCNINVSVDGKSYKCVVRCSF